MRVHTVATRNTGNAAHLAFSGNIGAADGTVDHTAAAMCPCDTADKGIGTGIHDRNAASRLRIGQRGKILKAPDDAAHSGVGGSMGRDLHGGRRAIEHRSLNDISGNPAAEQIGGALPTGHRDIALIHHGVFHPAALDIPEQTGVGFGPLPHCAGNVNAADGFAVAVKGTGKGIDIITDGNPFVGGRSGLPCLKISRIVQGNVIGELNILPCIILPSVDRRGKPNQLVGRGNQIGIILGTAARGKTLNRSGILCGGSERQCTKKHRDANQTCKPFCFHEFISFQHIIFEERGIGFADCTSIGYSSFPPFCRSGFQSSVP